MRQLIYAALLVVLWLLAWGDASLANLLSGAALAAVLLAVYPPLRQWNVTVHPLGVLGLTAYLLRQLAVSNVLVAREVISPRSKVNAGVIAYPVEDPFDALLAVLANVIAVTPGTMTVEVTRRPAVIYVHILLLHDVEAARRDIADLDRLCRGAMSPRNRNHEVEVVEGRP